MQKKYPVVGPGCTLSRAAIISVWNRIMKQRRFIDLMKWLPSGGMGCAIVQHGSCALPRHHDRRVVQGREEAADVVHVYRNNVGVGRRVCCSHPKSDG
jgi:hypothetical protein